MSVQLEFSVGPVQAFVAQARRTRDFWGGSYLLSFLTAHAIRGALATSAKICPEQFEKDSLVCWASGKRQGQPQTMGSVPNHFAATATDLEHAIRIARGAEGALREAWQRVCDAVWNKYVAAAEARGVATRAIWERQVSGFWEVVWVAGDNAPELLARRKLWRTHWPSGEPGDKCSVMPAYQELSGHIRARAPGAQDSFWARVRQETGDLDIQQNERLCAITLVKRMYAKCAQESIGWELETSAWPSTVDFAALPWVRRVLAVPESDALARTYAELVKQYAPPEAIEAVRHFRGLDNGGDFVRLNGDYMHPTSLANCRVTPLREKSHRRKLQDAFKAVAECQGADGRLGYPPRYYALLLGDGDRLGALLKESAGSVSARIVAALDRFTRETGPLSEASDAIRIYAGGDDVFALLPVEGALAYADKLALKYQDCFSGENLNGTLSGAVVFAQMTAPLTRVLTELHRLLDEVAKDQNGRNSLAVGVYQRSGLALEWVTTWQRNGSRAVDVLGGLAAILKQQQEPDLSSSVIHRVHHLLWRLLGEEGWRPGKYLRITEDLDIRKLILAEILRSLEKRSEPGADNQSKAATAASAIWDLLPVASSHEQFRRPHYINTDVLRLAGFLAGGGNEEEHQ